MSGKSNPFHSKEAEVVRLRAVASREKALKVLGKLQHKRPYVWAEIGDFSNPASQPVLDSLTGETSVALFVDHVSDPAASLSLPAMAALITRLWKNFNKLQILHRVESGQDGGSPEESGD